MTEMAARHLKLMAYADGELDGAERAEVEGWLASDVDAARFVEDLAVLGDYVSLAHAPAEVDLADAVMIQVKGVEAAKVVPLRPRSSARSRSVAIGGIVAALAVAAAVSFFTFFNRTQEEAPLGGGALATTIAPSSFTPARTGTGVDVDLHETPGQSVGVFYNETSVTTTSVTVWVDETGAK